MKAGVEPPFPCPFLYLYLAIVPGNFLFHVYIWRFWIDRLLQRYLVFMRYRETIRKLILPP